jgi:hypothetical protein
LNKERQQKRKQVGEIVSKLSENNPEVTVKNLRNDLEKYEGTNDVTFVYGNDKKGLKHIEKKQGNAKVPGTEFA